VFEQTLRNLFRPGSEGKKDHCLKTAGISVRPKSLIFDRKVTNSYLPTNTFCKTLSSMFLVFVVSSLRADPKTNVGEQGVGVQGYDPVAFFTDGRPVRASWP
jgi:hypothetical protein